jgi:hypothetical protein
LVQLRNALDNALNFVLLVSIFAVMNIGLPIGKEGIADQTPPAGCNYFYIPYRNWLLQRIIKVERKTVDFLMGNPRGAIDPG